MYGNEYLGDDPDPGVLLDDFLEPLLALGGALGAGHGADDGDLAAVGPEELEHLAHHYGAERYVRACQPFGYRHDVRNHIPVVHREPLASSPEAAHHLVADQQNAVTVTE